MSQIKIKTASEITTVIMTPVEMFYCLMCAVLVTLPIYISLHIIFFVKDFLNESRLIVKEFFTGPQDEKPVHELLSAEDHVLNNGGAFAERFTVSKV